MLKAVKELEMEETIIDKAKKNIKRLDTNIDTIHNSLTSHLSVLFFPLAVTAKYTAIAAI